MEMLLVFVAAFAIVFVIGSSMQQTACSKCRKQISRKATICPYCQNPV